MIKYKLLSAIDFNQILLNLITSGLLLSDEIIIFFISRVEYMYKKPDKVASYL